MVLYSISYIERIPQAMGLSASNTRRATAESLPSASKRSAQCGGTPFAPLGGSSVRAVIAPTTSGRLMFLACHLTAATACAIVDGDLPELVELRDVLRQYRVVQAVGPVAVLLNPESVIAALSPRV